MLKYLKMSEIKKFQDAFMKKIYIKTINKIQKIK